MILKEFGYSEKLLAKAAKDILDLYSTYVVMWSIRDFFAEDVRNIFKQTEEEDNELLEYYGKFIKEGMTTKEKIYAIAVAVNDRIIYKPDINVYGKVEYWARPIETHRKITDDCDGYSNLIVYVSRLFGAQPYEIFTRAGDVITDGGKTGGHANPIFIDIHSDPIKVYPIEGSFYPDRALRNFGNIPIEENKTYQDIWFVTNDVLSFSNFPLIKFVR